MNRSRGQRWSCWLWLASAIALAACGDTRPCKSGTLFVTVDFQGPALDADNLLVVVTPDGETARQDTFPHGPGTATGTVEVDFPAGYRAGRAVHIMLTAQKAGVVVATASQSLLLTDGCSTLRIQIADAGDDGGDTDAPLGGAGGGGSGAGGATGTGGGTGAGGASGTGAGGSATGGGAGPIDGSNDGPADGGCAPAEDCYNGVDDDCNGHVDCDDPACVPSAVCVPAAGTDGFVAGAYVDPITACPAGFVGGETAINATLNPGVGCTGCVCQSSITCTANLSRYANNLACTTSLGAPSLVGSIRLDLATGAAAPTSTCLVATFTMAMPPSVDAYVSSSAPCSPQGPPTRSTPTWAMSRKFCGASTIGAGCATGFVCVRRSPTNHCVLAAGAKTCPGGYTRDGGSWYTGFNDARMCGPCTCGAQVPGSCAPLRASFYTGTTCSSAVQASLASATKTCTFATDCQSAGFGGTPIVPSCPASSTLSGAATPTGEQTLCCAP
ncbi:MAG TPA: hypothetical protein VFH68_20615 [Polyangia bacterium]|nr:hypothetical protein [Polyangia bacterium]